MDRIELTATLKSLPSGDCDALDRSVRRATVIEYRADLSVDGDAGWLRNRFAGKRLLYTLRSHGEGGGCVLSAKDRSDRLNHAAKEFDLIDLEGDRDLIPKILNRIPPEKRIISWSGSCGSAEELRDRLDCWSKIPASLFRFSVASKNLVETFIPLQLLALLKGRRDVCAVAEGPDGAWTRIVSAQAGAPVVFGNAVSSSESAKDSDSLPALISNYGLPALQRANHLFAIAGDPINGSLSPRIHNAAYRASGRPALFVHLPAPSFDAFWQLAVKDRTLKSLGLPLRGITVASPHKEAALRKLDSVSPLCASARSTNVAIHQRGGWRAETTDASGLIWALKQHGVDPYDRKIAIVGCGGSGRAMAAALTSMGSKVTLVNRSISRGTRASHLLNLPFVPLSDFDPAGYSILINATPVGLRGEKMPFQLAHLSPGAIVAELIYKPGVTPLIREARTLGLRTIEGHEILIQQIRLQYELMNGDEIPLQLSREIAAARSPGSSENILTV